MKVLILGKGGMSAGIASILKTEGHYVFEVPKAVVDVRQVASIQAMVEGFEPDWVINCAGVSAPEDPWEEIATNLVGSINVTLVTTHLKIPTILIGSVAGLYGKPDHVGYSASKAGVISLAQSLGFTDEVYCISPGRVDTPMRQRDYPDDTPGSRLQPEVIGMVVDQVMRGEFEWGANVVVRIFGNYETGIRLSVKAEVNPWKEDLKVGQPVTV